MLPSTRRSVKKSRSCSTPEIRCFNCVNDGYGIQKFMINLISMRYLCLKFLNVVPFWLLSKKNSKLWPECMAIATMTWSCPGVEQSSIQGGKLPSSRRSIKSGAMHLAPAPDVKELSNFLLLERSGIQVWWIRHLCIVKTWPMGASQVGKLSPTLRLESDGKAVGPRSLSIYNSEQLTTCQHGNSNAAKSKR